VLIKQGGFLRISSARIQWLSGLASTEIYAYVQSRHRRQPAATVFLRPARLLTNATVIADIQTDKGNARAVISTERTQRPHQLFANPNALSKLSNGAGLDLQQSATRCAPPLVERVEPTAMAPVGAFNIGDTQFNF
jgi:hypothetical protein